MSPSAIARVPWATLVAQRAVFVAAANEVVRVVDDATQAGGAGGARDGADEPANALPTEAPPPSSAGSSRPAITQAPPPSAETAAEGAKGKRVAVPGPDDEAGGRLRGADAGGAVAGAGGEGPGGAVAGGGVAGAGGGGAGGGVAGGGAGGNGNPPGVTPTPVAPSQSPTAVWISWGLAGILGVLAVGYLVGAIRAAEQYDDFHHVGRWRALAVQVGVLDTDDASSVDQSAFFAGLEARRSELQDREREAALGGRALTADEQADLEAFADYTDDRIPASRSGRRSAIAFSCAAMAALVALLTALKKSERGLFNVIVGTDQRYSTSAAQLGLWTLAVGMGFAFMVGRNLFEAIPLVEALPDDRWDEYLILLGGPFAAAVLAKGTVSRHLETTTVQRTDGTPKLSQLATNEQGNTDLVDAQYLLFNLIALAYFTVQILHHAELPDIPDSLLALTSGTAALYVGNKVAGRNPPQITSALPRTAYVNDVVTVSGRNFAPGSSSDPGWTVLAVLDGRPVQPLDATDAQVRFRVPPGTYGAVSTVAVQTTAGVLTPDVEIVVATRTPEISAVSAALAGGRTVTITGTHLAPFEGTPPKVLVGGRLLDARAVDGSLEVDLPLELPAPSSTGTLPVVVQLDTSIRSVPFPAAVAVPSIGSVDALDGALELHGTGLFATLDSGATLRVRLDGRVLSGTPELLRAGVTDIVRVPLPAGFDPAVDHAVTLLSDTGAVTAPLAAV
jgi:hypothetical protein